MDLSDVTETERPLFNVTTNDSTPHLKSNVNVYSLDVMDIVQLSIAPVGIIGNLTVIVAFLSHRKLRRKIPNRFIVNQVRNTHIIKTKKQICACMCFVHLSYLAWIVCEASLAKGAKVMFSQASVILSHWGGWHAMYHGIGYMVWWGEVMTWGDVVTYVGGGRLPTSTWSDLVTSPTWLDLVTHPPLSQPPRIYTGTAVNERAVRNLLECILIVVFFFVTLMKRRSPFDSFQKIGDTNSECACWIFKQYFIQ